MLQVGGVQLAMIEVRPGPTAVTVPVNAVPLTVAALVEELE